MKKWLFTFGVCISLAVLVMTSGCVNRTQPPQSFGPTSFNISAGDYNDYTIPSINIGDRVQFNFSATGALVTYRVYDTNNNIILTGNGGNKTASGGGSFTASSAGRYIVQLSSTGIISSSVVTISYTVYYAH